MAFALKPFSWEDIDHSLVALRLSVINREMRKTSAEDLARIRRENRNNANHGAVSTQRLEKHLQRTDELAQLTYDAYCEVWAIQGNKKSAAFVRAIYEKAIHPLILNRCSILGELGLEEMRTGQSNTELTKARDAHFMAGMDRLAESWRTELEIEAMECAYADSGQQTQPASSKQIESTVETEYQQIPDRRHRAETVGRIISELKRQREVFRRGLPEDYPAIERNYPDSLSFKICKKHPDLHQKMEAIGDMNGITPFAFELAAALHHKAPSTMKSEYYKHMQEQKRASIKSNKAQSRRNDKKSQKLPKL